MKRPPRISPLRLALILGALFCVACPPAVQLVAEALLQVLTLAVIVLAWLLTAVVEAVAWLLTTPPGAALLGIAFAAALAHWAVSRLQHTLRYAWGRA